MCLIAEIIHTCSHEKVAQAAVASMGMILRAKSAPQPAHMDYRSAPSQLARFVNSNGASENQKSKRSGPSWIARTSRS